MGYSKDTYMQTEQLTLTAEELTELELERNQLNHYIMENSFLPQGYEPPVSGGGDYLKFKTASTKFRILSSPVMGYEGWTADNKPVRFKRKPSDAELANLRDRKAKHFWALIVYSYTDGKVMVLQITQGSIITAITAFAKDEAWGNPLNYDITVNKSGANLDTTYTVMPNPPTALKEDIMAVCMEAEGTIDLEQLFTGGNPFIA